MERITFNNIAVPAVSSHPGAPIFGELEKNIVLVFSGKSALALLLAYFRSTGALPDKTAEVLVPPWLGNWVYKTMHDYCFPTKTYGPEVRGMLVYHQWGFPQKMDAILPFAKEHNLFVIEDCAHAFESYYRGARVGTFGDAAIFSLAKFFPCVVGGAIHTNDDRIRSFIQEEVHEAGALEKRLFKERADVDLRPTHAVASLAEQYALYGIARGCVQQALDITRSSLAGGAMRRRKEHVEHLRKELDPKDTFGLYEDGVVPWVLPLFLEKERMFRVTKALEEMGVESGIFHFDVNRNMLDPDYRECIALPCHDGISDRQLGSIIRTVQNAV